MKVKNVYQDASGKWHIEYSPANLMGLALRVYGGEFLISIWVLIFVGLPFVLITMVSAKSLPNKQNISSPSNFDILQESICREISNEKLKFKNY